MCRRSGDLYLETFKMGHGLHGLCGSVITSGNKLKSIEEKCMPTKRSYKVSVPDLTGCST